MRTISNRTGIVLGLLFLSVWAVSAWAMPLPGGTLDPLTIPKYVDPLPIPGKMPNAPVPANSPVTLDPNSYYEIAVRQFQQKVLSTGTPGNPMTKVWSYGAAHNPATFHYPAFTIEAQYNTPVTVKWMNQLVVNPDACATSLTPATDPNCQYLPHLLPVDRSLHWANPERLMCKPMGNMGSMPITDCRPDPLDPFNVTVLGLPYDGPVPIVTHLHGAHVNPHSDGYPESWWLPRGSDPQSYATRGSNFDQAPGFGLEDGAATYQYRNDQRATTLWYHDHSLGMTRTNVYAGPAGFYMLRGGPDDVPSNVPGGLPGGPYEIPIVIQDRSFNADGSLFYPDSRSFFDGFAGPYIGSSTGPSDIAPIWNPEFFGNTMVVNGKTWPRLDVEPRKYRFRFLNGSDSRFLILKLSNKRTFTQIGSDGGFLPAPVVLSQLLIGPAERADVIVDFTGLPAGTAITLLNAGPDMPFGGPVPVSQQADPATTGQVMQFKVGTLTAPDTSAIPPLPKITPLRKPNAVRKVSLNELESNQVCVDGANVWVAGVSPPACSKGTVPLAPLEAQLGTIDPITGLGVPKAWMDPITETPALNNTEVWEIHNFTADAHPIHLHQVMFQVVNRQVMGGKTRGPEVWETGFKDTVVSYPGEITRVKAYFDIGGLYVWHCHILSHEDNEMMRPFCVGGGCTP